ncbi:hypothetical protein RV17_GL000727 [Enterococcus thailandicus]|nr:hypothetical protein RV17_GL000727 [Enterococcus thailandicus]
MFLLKLYYKEEAATKVFHLKKKERTFKNDSHFFYPPFLPFSKIFFLAG